MQVDWFVSVRDEETGVHRYRGGAGGTVTLLNAGNWENVA